MAEEEKDTQTEEQTTPEETTDTDFQKEVFQMLTDLQGIMSNIQQSVDKLSSVESERVEQEEEKEEEPTEEPTEIESPEEVSKMLDE